MVSSEDKSQKFKQTTEILVNHYFFSLLLLNQFWVVNEVADKVKWKPISKWEK